MRPKEIATRLGIDESTLRLWTSGEFKMYLSPRAQGGDGRHRNYTDQDSRILAYIKEMRDENATTEDIHAGLKSLQAMKWTGLPVLPDAPGAVISMIPREAAETRVDMQRQTYANEIQEYQRRIADIEAKLEKSEDQRETLLRERADLMKRVGELEGQLSERQTSGELISQNKELAQQVGELQGKLAERQSTRFWLRMIATVIIASIVITVVVAVLLTLVQR